MDDLSRWLRFLLPGAMYELLVGGWLYFDTQICHCYGRAPDLSDGAAVAIAAIAALPFGFMSSNVASWVAWRARRHDAWAEWCLLQWDDEAILAHSADRLEIMEWSLKPSEEEPNVLDASTRSDLALHLVMGTKGFDRAAERMRRLLDLSNATSNVLAAVFLGFLTILGAAATSSMTIDGDPDWKRIAWLVAWCSIAMAVAYFVRDSQRRVAEVCGAYLTHFR